MAGLGYKDFTAGAVLTAAQVDGYLMEQAVMNFAGTAARGSALSGVVAAGMVAHVGAGTLTVYDGSAWQQVHPASAGLTYIAGTAFTAGSAISVNNCFTSTYDNYRLVLRLHGSVNTIHSFRLRLSGTDNSAASYSNNELFKNVGSASAGFASGTAVTSGRLGSHDTTPPAITVFDISGPALAEHTAYVSNNGYVSQLEVISGVHAVGTAFDGITILPSSGTITGSIRIYGYRNS